MNNLPLTSLLAVCSLVGGLAACSARASDGEAAAAPDAADTRRIADFSDPQEPERWRVMNDDVMGGRSEGDAAFNDGRMTFFGDINTDGGGFSSIRRPLEPGALAGAAGVRLRVKADGRPYRVTVRDGSRIRRGEVQFRVPIDAPAAEGWQDVAVAFADLEPMFHGDVVDAEPFNPAAAAEIGLILNDTVDGPFRLEVAWIAAVSAAR